MRTFLLAFVLVGMAWGQDDSVARNSLVGIKQLEVSVADLNQDIDADGLHVYDLRTDAELALRKAGLRVIPDGETNVAQGWPMLQIDMISLPRGEDGLYTFSIRAEMRQAVSLTRPPERVVFATTWSTWYVGHVGKNNARDVRSSVLDLVNQFLNAWLAANGK